MFMSIALIRPSPTACFTRLSLQRQNAVEDLSSSTTTTITTTNKYNIF